MDVEGVRYVVTSMPDISPVRLKDKIVQKNAAKNTLIFNLLTSGGTFYIDEGKVHGFKNKGTSPYSVDLIVYYGFSEYNGEKRGFKLICARNAN